MENQKSVLSIGDKLPDLTLFAYDPREDRNITIETRNYRQKWMVFFFYPADFTFICPTELKELGQLYGEFEKEGAEIFSVSTDTVYVHKAWHDHSEALKKVQFPMIGDPAGELAKLFGAYIAVGNDAGLALRGTYIVDPDGVLKTIEVNSNDIGRNSRETLRKLRAEKFVRGKGGIEVCPASWEPGGETLKPGVDLVGKI